MTKGEMIDRCSKTAKELVVGTKGLAKGLTIGATVLLSLTIILSLLGCYNLCPDITYMHGGDFHVFLLTIFIYLIVALIEEMVFRGLLFRLTAKWWGTITGCAVSSLAFGFAHIMSPGASWWSSIAIALSAGILLAVAYKQSGSLWMPIGIHWAWNVFEGPVLGYQVSGQELGPSILHSYITGPSILTGGPFGPEASVVTIGICWIMIVVLTCKNRLFRTEHNEDCEPYRHTYHEG